MNSRQNVCDHLLSTSFVSIAQLRDSNAAQSLLSLFESRKKSSNKLHTKFSFLERIPLNSNVIKYFFPIWLWPFFFSLFKSREKKADEPMTYHTIFSLESFELCDFIIICYR